MAIDLGDPVPLVFYTRDATGALASVTTAVLTITLPDGTSVTPAVALGAVGTYAPTTPYISVQSGIHRVSWVGSGVNAQDYTDVFNVLPADPRFLISLADARAALGTVAANTVKDEDLRWALAAVTPIIERKTGPILTATKTWTVDGGAAQILLPSAVTSVQSVTDTGVLLTPGADYTVNLRSGIVTRGTLLYPFRFLPGIQNVTTVYTVGGSVVSPGQAYAARITLRQLWLVSGQQGLRPSMGSPGAASGAPVGFLLPNAALEALEPTPNVPGFA